MEYPSDPRGSTTGRKSGLALRAGLASLDASIGRLTLVQMLEHQIFRDPNPGNPRVLAVFSFRYDVHLVAGLLANIRPFVQGYVAWNDRDAGVALSDEPTRRNERTIFSFVTFLVAVG